MKRTLIQAIGVMTALLLLVDVTASLVLLFGTRLAKGELEAEARVPSRVVAATPASPPILNISHAAPPLPSVAAREPEATSIEQEPSAIAEVSSEPFIHAHRPSRMSLKSMITHAGQ